MTAGDDRMLWATPGFARGFCALEDNTEVEYLCTATWSPKSEGGIRWNDPALGIQWPVTSPVLSEKDRSAASLTDWLSDSRSALLSLSQDRAEGL